MGAAAQHESRLDPLSGARQQKLLDAAGTVLPSELLGRDTCVLEDARVGNELARGRGSHRIEVRHRLRRRLDGSLARTLSPRVLHDALLCGTKSDHGRRGDREREHNGQCRLAALVA